MYFIPKVNQNIHKSTGHLEKDIKLMKEIDLTICLEKFSSVPLEMGQITIFCELFIK